MKTLHLSIIISSFALVSILSSIAYGSEPCPPSGYIHYGPSRQSVPCYLVYGQLNLNQTLEDLFGNSTNTTLVHDNAILILNQTTKQLVYASGQNITIIPELINIGGQNVTISYEQPLFYSEVLDQNGKKVWPPGPWAQILFAHSKILEPGMPYSGEVANYQPEKQVFVIDVPGSYTVKSIASFAIYENLKKPFEVSLEAKPIHRTIVPERYITMRLMVESTPTSSNLIPPQDRQIHLRFFDSNTNNPMANLTFGMNVTKGNQTFLQNTFWTRSGSFTLNLKPGERYLWAANPDHDPMDGLYYSKGDKIDIDTSYLTRDLCHFSIMPIFGYQGYSTSPQISEIKFETDLNLLSAYNKTIVPNVIPEFPLAIPILLIGFGSVLVLYNMRTKVK